MCCYRAGGPWKSRREHFTAMSVLGTKIEMPKWDAFYILQSQSKPHFNGTVKWNHLYKAKNAGIISNSSTPVQKDPLACGCLVIVWLQPIHVRGASSVPSKAAEVVKSEASKVLGLCNHCRGGSTGEILSRRALPDVKLC